MDLGDRLAELGRQLGAREAAHGDDLARARAKAAELHGAVATAVERFEEAVGAAGGPVLGIQLEEPRLDEKHVRAIEFSLRRGRHGAVVTVKSRGEVTLVGPFRIGKVEGPCRSFPFEVTDEFELALADFLESFLDAAMSP